MAGRPKKQKVDYFFHYTDATDGRTLTILQDKFGNDGYAVWFKLLERLGVAEGHYYNCRSKMDWDYLVAKFHISPLSATEILDMLAELDAIDKGLWDNRIIWCQKFVNGLAEVYRKRGQPLPIKPIYGTDITATPLISATEIQPSTIVKTEHQSAENTIIDNINNSTPPITATEIQPVTIIPATENTQRRVEESRGENRGFLQQILEKYEKTFGGTINHSTVEKIKDTAKTYPFEWISDAMDEAIKYNKRSWGYVETILNRWLTEGKNNGHKKQELVVNYRTVAHRSTDGVILNDDIATP